MKHEEFKKKIFQNLVLPSIQEVDEDNFCVCFFQERESLNGYNYDLSFSQKRVKRTQIKKDSF